MGKGLYALGVVVSVGILLVLALGTFIIYMVACAKHPSKRKKIDTVFIVFVVGISLVIRMVAGINFLSDQIKGTMYSGVASFFHGIFSAVAGLTFNSLLELSDFENGILASLYFGIIAYASLMFLSIVSVGLSYTMYSFLRLLPMRWKGRKYYIFTAVSTDSLCLAKSIKEHEEAKKTKYKIIFFDDGTESFSRKNPLHREIMESGFLYFSSSRTNDKGETISFLKKFMFRKKFEKIIEEDKEQQQTGSQPDTKKQNKNKKDTKKSKSKNKGKYYGDSFHVFATSDGKDYEGVNAEAIFNDYQAVLRDYVEVKYEKDKNKRKDELRPIHIRQGIPVVVNYHLLTGGEINYESYQRKVDKILNDNIDYDNLVLSNQELDAFAQKDLEKTKDGMKKENEELEKAKKEPKHDLSKAPNEISDEVREMVKSMMKVAFFDTIKSKLQVHVFNEATLSSYDFVSRRNTLLKHMADSLGSSVFEKDTAPDGDNVYRVAVIGFGKTGQYTMEELYTHTAHLVEDSDEYGVKIEGPTFKPTQFIADIYDSKMEDKSGAYAYSHPFVRCLNCNDDQNIGANGQKQNGDHLLTASEILDRASKIKGDAYDVLYSYCIDQVYEKEKKKSGGDSEKLTMQQAKVFVDTKMAFPIAVFHDRKCFRYPFIDENESGEVAIDAVKNHGIHNFIVALGNDESDVAMANMLIDSFRRCKLKGEMEDVPHIKIYVNIFEERNELLLNIIDEDINGQCGEDKEGNKVAPWLSVIPYGCRERIYSYNAIVENYKEKLFNYLYNKLTDDTAAEKFVIPEGELAKYAEEDACTDKWLEASPFDKLSTKSVYYFSRNYYEYNFARGKQAVEVEQLQQKDKIHLKHLEHERWDRFHISHGWICAPYDYTGQKKYEFFEKLKKCYKNEIKYGKYRYVKQHNCLLPFDVVLDDTSKRYDACNVDLGFHEKVVYDEQERKEREAAMKSK